MHLNRSLRFLQFWDEDATSCGWGRAVRGNASSWPGWGVRKITTWWKIREQKWSKMYPFPFFGFDWPPWRDPSCWITLNRSSHTKCVCDCLCIRSRNNDWWKDTRLHGISPADLLSLTPGSSATHKRAGSDKWDRLLSRKKKVKAAVVELLHVQYMCLLAVILSEERCVVSAWRPGWWSVLNVEKMMQR